MIELQVLALAGLPLRRWRDRYGHVRATRAVAAERESLFELLSDLDRHWLLAEGFVEEVRMEGPPGARNGGEVMLRGPLGLRRRARTSVLVSAAPHLIMGRAQVGRRTVAHVTWVLARGRRDSTEVELSATIDRVGVLDALLLVLGATRWLERRFDATLAVLAELAAAGGQDHRPVFESDGVQRVAA